MARFKNIISYCLIITICVWTSGCTPSQTLGVYFTWLLLESCVDAQQIETAKPKKQNFKPRVIKIRRKPVKRKPEVVEIKQKPKKSFEEKILNAYQDLKWDLCLKLASEKINSSNSSYQDKCISRILAGSIHYQNGNTDAAEKYFHSECKLQDFTDRHLLSPELTAFYGKINSP